MGISQLPAISTCRCHVWLLLPYWSQTHNAVSLSFLEDSTTQDAKKSFHGIYIFQK
jgi:hypothetical protein